MKKKILWIVGGLLLLLVVTVATLPFVIDANKFRPQIISAIEGQINGTVSIGQMKLTVLRGLGVKIQDVSISQKGQKIFEVGEMTAALPWTRLLISPVLNIHVHRPSVTVVQRKDGSMNVMDLIKKSNPTANNSQDKAKGTPETAEKKSTSLPGIVLRAAVNFRLLDGVVHYSNAQGQKAELSPLTVELLNASLTREMTLKATVPMKMGDEQGGLALAGVWKTDFLLSPKMNADQGTLSELVVRGVVDLSDLSVRVAPLIRKAKGQALKLELETTYTPEKVTLAHLGITLGGSKAGLKGEAGLADSANPTLKFQLNVGPAQLREMTQLLTGVGDAEGTMALTGSIEGTLEAPRVALNFDLNGKKLKPEGFKEALDQLTVKMNLNTTLKKSVDGYQPQQMNLSMPKLLIAKGKESIQGVMSLKGTDKAADLRLTVTSEGADLDDWLGVDTSAAKSSGGATSTATSSTGAEQVVMPLPERLKLLDQQLKSVKKIAILKNTKGRVQFDFKKVKVTGLQIEPLKLHANVDRLQFQMDQLLLGIFTGKIQGTSTVNLRSAKPQLAGKIQATGIDLEQATQFAAPSMKGLVKGKMDSQGQLNAEGILWEDLQTQLTGSGDITIKDAILSTLPIGRWVQEAMAKVKGIGQLSGKLDKTVSQDYGDKIKSFVAKANIAKGVITLNPVNFEYATGDIGFQGQGTIDFAQNLNFDGSAKASAQVVPVAELKGADGRSWVPLRFRGTLSAPSVDFGFTAGEVAKKVAGGKAKQLIQDKAKDLIKQPEIKQGLNKLFKGKLF